MNKTVLTFFPILCLLSTIFLIGFQISAKANLRLPVYNIDTGIDYEAIQEAINANETLDEHTIFVEKGIYYEHVVVNKSVTLIGENRSITIIDGYGNGTVMKIEANNVTVVGFTIQNSSQEWCMHECMGIYIDHSSNNNIKDNFITNNYFGIYLYKSCNNILSGNNVYSNNNDGIELYSSSNSNIILNNIVTNHWLGIRVDRDSTNNFLSRNTVSNNYFGIRLDVFSGNNTVFGNAASNNTFGIGVTFSSNNNAIFGNNVSNNFDGIRITYSNNNLLSGNKVSNNDNGIYLISSNNSVIYHTNFINNTQQITSINSTNTWDNGYPSGGNYWSDYNGTDLNQDGIGDTPYTIDENNQDRYPLMTLYIPATMLRVLYDELLEKYSNLLTDFDALNSTYYELLSSYHSLNQTCSKLLGNITELQGKYDSLLNMTSDMQEQINSLNSTLQGRIDSLNFTTQTSIDSLRKEVMISHQHQMGQMYGVVMKLTLTS